MFFPCFQAPWDHAFRLLPDLVISATKSPLVHVFHRRTYYSSDGLSFLPCYSIDFHLTLSLRSRTCDSPWIAHCTQYCATVCCDSCSLLILLDHCFTTHVVDYKSTHSMLYLRTGCCPLLRLFSFSLLHAFIFPSIVNTIFIQLFGHPQILLLLS